MATLYEIDSKLIELIDNGFSHDCVDEMGDAFQVREPDWTIGY